jgi:hypothetical protein
MEPKLNRDTWEGIESAVCKSSDRALPERTASPEVL